MKDVITKKRFSWLVGVILALVIVQFLFNPLSWFASLYYAVVIPWELRAARERWELNAPPGYAVDVQGGGYVCFFNHTLEFREDQLSAVIDRGSLLEALAGYTPKSKPVPPEEWDIRQWCPLSDLSVPNMHLRIAKELERLNTFETTLIVHFDPEYGYVTDYQQSCTFSGGLLSPRISHCGSWLKFSGFKPVIDS